MIDAPECKIRVEADTERKAAEAAEAILRLCGGQTLSISIEIECIDELGGDRILIYLSDLADKLERH